MPCSCYGVSRDSLNEPAVGKDIFSRQDPELKRTLLNQDAPIGIMFGQKYVSYSEPRSRKGSA